MFDTVRFDRVSIAPFGEESCASTSTNESSDVIIAELSNSTVQVTVTVDITLTGVGGLLVIDTETGGTTEERDIPVYLLELLSIAKCNVYFVRILFSKLKTLLPAAKY